MTTIAILGAGSVGRALGERFLHAGAQVRFGVRDPRTAAGRLIGPLTGAPALVPANAAAPAEIVVLAVPAAAAVEVAQAAGDLSGKTLLDCTNPLRWDNGPVWVRPREGSVAEALAVALPGASVVKGFNHFGAEIQRDPALPSGPADALFAGDHADAKARIMDLARQMGFRPHDAGPLRNAALLENLAVLWIQLATARDLGRNFNFRIEGRS